MLADRPELAPIDSSLLRECPKMRSGEIPAGDQPPAVVFPLILDDLENYQVCRVRHHGLIRAVKAVYANQGK